MDMVDKELEKVLLVAKQKAEQKIRQETLDKERAQLMLMAMRAELESRFSR